MVADWDLLQPLWLLATPLPALLWLLRRSGRLSWHLSSLGIHEPMAVRHPWAHLFNKTLDTRHSDNRLFLAYSLAGILLLVALAQPVKYGAPVTTLPQPVDLTLVIDTSVSMFLKDYEIEGQPVDRMTMAKALLDRFAERFGGRRLGIVVFGDKPYVLLKPSEDKDLVRNLIARLRTSMAGRQAAIGDAITIASTQALETTRDTDKVLVLISDAVQPVGSLSPRQAAQQAAQAGITLHTIAIGATDSKVAQDSTGQLIYQAANTKLLKDLAIMTGGKYFHATDTQAMDQALHSIEAQHTVATSIASGPRLQRILYIWPLLCAMLILAMINLMPYQRRAL